MSAQNHAPDRFFYKGHLYRKLAYTQDDAVVEHLSKLAKDMVSIADSKSASFTKIGRMKDLFQEMKQYFTFIVSDV